MRRQQVDAEEAASPPPSRRSGAPREAEAQAVVAEAEAAEQDPAAARAGGRQGRVLHRFKVEQDNLEREAQRAAARQRELEGRIAQLGRDLAREESLIAEAKETLARLDAETELLANTTRLAGRLRAEGAGRYDEADSALKVAEVRLADLTTRTAESARAPAEPGVAARASARGRSTKLERQMVALDAQTREIVGRAPDASKLKAAAEIGQTLMAEIAEIEARTVAAEDAVQAAAADAKAKAEAAARLGLTAGQLKTEVETLAKLLMPAGDSGLPPVLDQIKVAAGYEMALAAALGEDLDVPAAEEAPVHWRINAASGTDPALPKGVEPLIVACRGAARADAPPAPDRHRRPGRRSAPADAADRRPASGLPRGRSVALGRVRRRGSERRWRPPAGSPSAAASARWLRRRRSRAALRDDARAAARSRHARCIARRRPRSAACASAGARRRASSPRRATC